jgi:hypothetical protein
MLFDPKAINHVFGDSQKYWHPKPLSYILGHLLGEGLLAAQGLWDMATIIYNITNEAISREGASTPTQTSGAYLKSASNQFQLII